MADGAIDSSAAQESQHHDGERMMQRLQTGNCPVRLDGCLCAVVGTTTKTRDERLNSAHHLVTAPHQICSRSRPDFGWFFQEKSELWRVRLRKELQFGITELA
jgi:hypothetical protein